MTLASVSLAGMEERHRNKRKAQDAVEWAESQLHQSILVGEEASRQAGNRQNMVIFQPLTMSRLTATTTDAN